MAATFRVDGTVRNSVGLAISSASVYICTQPLTSSLGPPIVIPPAPLASIFSDPAGAVPLANPVISDGNGNFFFYAAPGVYTFVFFDSFNRIPSQAFADQEVVSPGGGSVTSVGLTMPTEFTVAGSPVVAGGTLAVTKANQNANAIYAGPASGGAAPPAFRPLVAADLPAGTGTVTSVAETITPTAPLTGSISGSPITGAGTLGITIGIANQPANTVLAGPTSGGSGAVTARALVPPDLPGQTTVAFSATPVFNAQSVLSFKITLTGDVTSSTITNPTAGQRVAFIITQDGVGGHAFAYPANVKGASGVAPDAGLTTVQEFIYDGVAAVWRALGAGTTSL
jgi:hypothetical protein